MVRTITLTVESPYVRLIKAVRPKARLFWFPFAGAGASAVRDLAELMDSRIEIAALQLPGREDRLNEPAFTDMGPLTRALAQAVRPYLDVNAAFFGHSAGAIIAFEVARLIAEYRLAPTPRLFVAGHRAPHHPMHHVASHNQPTDVFLARVRSMEAESAALDNPALHPVLLPALRADFAIWERYRYLPGPPLTAPLTVFGGDRDRAVSIDDLEAWRSYTVVEFRLIVLPGGHFFVRESTADIVAEISAQLT